MSLRQWISMMAIFARVFRAMPNLSQDLREISEMLGDGADLPNTIGYSIINIAENKQGFARAMQSAPLVDAVRMHVVSDPLLTTGEMVDEIEGMYQKFTDGSLAIYVDADIAGTSWMVSTEVPVRDNLLSVVNTFVDAEEL